jgi:hypothetical protein
MKALIIDNEVRDIEKRDINVFEYYHEDVAKLFVDCTEDVSIGDIYKDGAFIKRDEVRDE